MGTTANTDMRARCWIETLAAAAVLAAFFYVSQTAAAVLDFESGGVDRYFVFDRLGPYQPNPYDAPADGADRLATHTASDWVGMLNGTDTFARLLWDGGMEGGANSALNLLLPDTFDLVGFVIAGVYGAQTVTVQGLDDGRLRYSRTFAIDLAPRAFHAAWSAIDELRIAVGDDFMVDPDHASAAGFRNWAIDNVVYDEAAGPVPVPGAGWLLLGGTVSLAALARRRPRPCGGASHELRR